MNQEETLGEEIIKDIEKLCDFIRQPPKPQSDIIGEIHFTKEGANLYGLAHGDLILYDFGNGVKSSITVIVD